MAVYLSSQQLSPLLFNQGKASEKSKVASVLLKSKGQFRKRTLQEGQLQKDTREKEV